MSPAADLTIRAYRPSDLDAVIAVFQDAIRQIASRDYTPGEIAAWSEVNRDGWATRRMSRPTWVAAIGGSVVGFSDLEPGGHLDMMFVHPAHQRVGIATALLATVEAAARSKGMLQITTDASRTARPFFERRGFTVVAPQLVEKRGERLENFRMSKVLA